MLAQIPRWTPFPGELAALEAPVAVVRASLLWEAFPDLPELSVWPFLCAPTSPCDISVTALTTWKKTPRVCMFFRGRDLLVFVSLLFSGA